MPSPKNAATWTPGAHSFVVSLDISQTSPRHRTKLTVRSNTIVTSILTRHLHFHFPTFESLTHLSRRKAHILHHHPFPRPLVCKMSLRIAPPSSHPQTTSNTTTKTSSSSSFTSNQHPKGAPSAPGLPDTLRLSQSTTSTTSSPQPSLSSTHPLESRLLNWTTTQDSLKLETLRRTYGIAEPVRRGMELKIVREGAFTPAVLGGSAVSVHEDILAGRDAEVSWEDVYTHAGRVVGTGAEGAGGVHEEMEARVGMGRW
ncbi:hypothetical protein GJ744_011257 [Endocarpon pusillum]|uniref:Uncharacterized protein n=1 Tax=Endocarpon pusillum TaxID=364733 RepID=A0A8H7AU03_9EURO|nr:hypothetical protein GJ744_011257 [Endocarpon pusillum]